jgi:hypothetical protein
MICKSVDGQNTKEQRAALDKVNELSHRLNHANVSTADFLIAFLEAVRVGAVAEIEFPNATYEVHADLLET